MKITTKQKKFLENYIDNLEQVLLSDDINDLLLAIDDVVIDSFDAAGNPSEEGIKLQRIYDEIYSSN